VGERSGRGSLHIQEIECNATEFPPSIPKKPLESSCLKQIVHCASRNLNRNGLCFCCARKAYEITSAKKRKEKKRVTKTMDLFQFLFEGLRCLSWSRWRSHKSPQSLCNISTILREHLFCLRFRNLEFMDLEESVRSAPWLLISFLRTRRRVRGVAEWLENRNVLTIRSMSSRLGTGAEGSFE